MIWYAGSRRCAPGWTSRSLPASACTSAIALIDDPHGHWLPLCTVAQNALRVTAAAALILISVAACALREQPVDTRAEATGPASAGTASAPTAVPRSGSNQELILATTTSTQDSGLLDVLVPL